MLKKKNKIQKAKELGIKKINCAGNNRIMFQLEGDLKVSQLSRKFSEISQIEKDFEHIFFRWSRPS